MDRDDPVNAGVRLHAALKRPFFKVYIFYLQQAEFLRPPPRVALDQQNVNSGHVPERFPKKLHLFVRKRDVLFFDGSDLFDGFLRQVECPGIVPVHELILKGVVQHQVEQGLDLVLHRRGWTLLNTPDDRDAFLHAALHMARTNVKYPHFIHAGAILPSVLQRLCDRYRLFVFSKPLPVQLFHGDRRIQVVGILIVVDQGLVGFVVCFKIGFRFERFSVLVLPYRYHGPEWLSQISVLDLADLSEAVWQTPAFEVLVSGVPLLDCLFHRISAMWTGFSLVADLQIAFRTFDKHR